MRSYERVFLSGATQRSSYRDAFSCGGNTDHFVVRSSPPPRARFPLDLQLKRRAGEEEDEDG